MASEPSGSGATKRLDTAILMLPAPNRRLIM